VVATARRPEQLTSAWNWTEEKRVRYSALQAEARQQAQAAGIVLDADLISGDEVGSIVKCARRHHADLLVLGMPEAQLADDRSHSTGYCRTCAMCSSGNQIGAPLSSAKAGPVAACTMAIATQAHLSEQQFCIDRPSSGRTEALSDPKRGRQLC